MSKDQDQFEENLENLAVIGRTGTVLDKQGESTDPIYERKDIVPRVAALLAHNADVLLIGESGTGKNAIVEDLAGKLAAGKLSNFPWQHIVQVNTTSLQSNCRYVHDMDRNTVKLVKACEAEKVIIFFDEIHLGAGAGSTSNDPRNDCITTLDNSRIKKSVPLIGATTPDGYKELQKKHPGFVNRFAKIDVPPTDHETTLNMLRSVRESLEDKYSVELRDDMFEEIIRLYGRFYPWQWFPGKVFEGLKQTITQTRADAPEGQKVTITSGHLHALLKKNTGLRDFMIEPNIQLDVTGAKRYFQERIFEQNHAVDELISAILEFKQRVNEPGKPVGSFIFVGPSGVGKTELAKVLAEYLFGSEDKLLVYPMSQYQGVEGMRHLLGGGWWRSEEVGRLAGDVKASPFSVILFDEIDQASPEVVKALYQILGEGKLIDPSGKVAPFTASIIILSTNLGMEKYFDRLRIGFSGSDKAQEQQGEISEELYYAIKNTLEGKFGRAFVDRITKIIPFFPLNQDTIRKVAKKTIKEAGMRPGFQESNIKVKVDGVVLNLLVAKGYDVEYGARPMQTAVRDIIVVPIARYLNYHPELKNTTLTVKLKGGKISVQQKKQLD